MNIIILIENGKILDFVQTKTILNELPMSHKPNMLAPVLNASLKLYKYGNI